MIGNIKDGDKRYMINQKIKAWHKRWHKGSTKKGKIDTKCIGFTRVRMTKMCRIDTKGVTITLKARLTKG